MFKIQRISTIIPLALLFIGLVAGLLFSAYTYNAERKSTLERAQASGFDLMQRATKMFLVSTDKFHNQLAAAETEQEKNTVTADWTRTIRAIDQAIIADFGESQSRVRLLGDKDLVGITPLGGKDTKLEIPFEKDIIKKFAGGLREPIIVTDEEAGKLRIAAPATSDMHPGCAECHGVSVSEKKLLGGLAVYVPITGALAEATNNAIHNALLTAGMFLVVLVVIYLLVRQRIMKPINDLTQATSDLSSGNGDLTYRIKYDRDDEFGGLTGNLNKFIETLHGIFQDISKTGSHLADTAEQSSEASATTADIVEHQRKETLSVFSAVTEMNNMAEEMAVTTTEAVEQVKTAEKDANAGVEQVQGAVHTLEKLVSTLFKGKETVNRLEKDSEGIGSILDVIRGISEQTNLLALNAAIEAARAGEQGRGFAVVADEVRTLAQRTQVSVEEIQKTIESLQSASREAVTVMETGHDEGSQTVNMVHEAAEELNTVIGSFIHLTEKNQVVANAVDNQTKIVADIYEIIQKINDFGEQTAEQANNASNVGSDLTQVSSKLTQLMGKFKL